MFTPLKPPRGPAAAIAAHTGVEGSIVVNLDAKTIHVHDGVTAGGFALSKVGHQHTKNEVLGFLGYIPVDPAVIGQANGVAPLDSTGKVPASMIPGGVGGGGGVSDAGDLTGDTLAANVLHSSLTSVGVLEQLSVIGVIAGSVSGSASKLATARNIAITGDATGSASFDGSDDASIAMTLADVNSAPVADGFVKVTTNSKGLVVATSAVDTDDIAQVLGYVPVAKSYVDDVAAGMVARAAVRTASTAALTATYNNGTGGNGATLTGTGSVPAIGGVTPNLNDRVLVKDQAAGLQNGPYVLTQVNPWILTRADDVDTMTAGSAFYVQEGTLQGSRFAQTTVNPTVGTTALSYTQVEGGATLTAGAGIDIQSNVITNTGVRSLAGSTNQISFSASTGAITASLTPSVTISGTMTAGAFSGSGAALTGLNASNLGSGTVPTARLGSGTADGTKFLSGDGTWKTPSVSVTALSGTGSNPRVTGTKGIYAGVDSNGSPSMVWSNTSAAAGAKASYLYVNNTGVIGWALMSDDFQTATNFLTVNRSGNTASSITLAGTAFAIQANTSIAGTLNVSSVITGNGSGLTALNASNLSAGTVPVARLGSGTASNQTYLRGDGTWATASSNALIGTGLITRTVGTAGVYIGVDNAALPLISISNPQAASGSRLTQMFVDNAGSYTIGFANDGPSSQINWMKVDRSGMTATLITFTASAMTINAPVTATSFTGTGTGLTALNASNLASGTVPVARMGSGTANNTTFLRGDGTWQVVNMGAATTLTATGALTFSSFNAADGIYIGRRISTSGPPSMYFTQTGSNINARMWRFQTLDDGGGNGQFVFQTVSDADNAAQNVMSFSRSGMTPGAITIYPDLTVNGTISGNGSGLTALNASNLGSGTVPTARLGTGTASASTVLRGDGTWGIVTAASATAQITPAVATSSISIGVGADTVPRMWLINGGANAGVHASAWQTSGAGGDITFNLYADNLSTSSSIITINRSANTATNFTVAATAITLNGAVTATSVAATHTGDGSGLTNLNAGNLGSGTVPTVRLGSGTANSTTFLRGDGTWAAPATSANNLNGTGTTPRSGTVSGLYGGVDTNSQAVLTFTNGSLTAGNRVSNIYYANDGTIRWDLTNDAINTGTSWLTITRSGNTATNVAIAGTAITLTGAVTGTSFSGVGTNLTALNASNLSSGTVPTARLGTGTADSTTYLRGDGTWASVAGGNPTANNIQAASGTTSASFITGDQTGASASGAVTIGSGNTSGGTNTGAVTIKSGNSSVGATQSGTITIVTGNVPAAQSSGAINLTTGTNLTGGGGPTGSITLTTGSSASAGGTAGNISLIAGTGASTSGYVAISTANTQRVRFLPNGAWSVGTDAVSTGGAGQVLTSNGSGSAPTWQTVSAVVTQIPRVTTFDATAKGKRIAVTAGFTVPNNTYAAGDYFSFYNDSAADILITQAAGLTMWLDGTTQTGNRTLRARGTCSLWFNSATEAVITGSVL